MQIEWACTRLVNLFNLLSDSRAHDEAAALFVPDGTYIRPGRPALVGRNALAAAFRQDPPGRKRHFVTNVVVDVVSPVEAKGRSYLLLASSTDEAEGCRVADRPLVAGEVAEQFALTEEGWRFAAREGSATFTWPPR